MTRCKCKEDYYIEVRKVRYSMIILISLIALFLIGMIIGNIYLGINLNINDGLNLLIILANSLTLSILFMVFINRLEANDEKLFYYTVKYPIKKENAD